MLGNIGELLLKCKQKVTKGHSYHLLGVLDYYVIYIGTGHSQFCAVSAKITNWVTDGSVTFFEKFVDRGRDFDVSPKVQTLRTDERSIRTLMFVSNVIAADHYNNVICLQAKANLHHSWGPLKRFWLIFMSNTFFTSSFFLLALSFILEFTMD